MSAQYDSKPFRLIDLPTELRLMIYKRLPRQIKHPELRCSRPQIDGIVDSKIILVTRRLPTAVLRTSHQINAEARTIVSAILQRFVVESQPRIIGHDIHIRALLAFVPHIVAERRAQTNHESYHLGALGERHGNFNHSPWKTERSENIARFLVQTAFTMTRPVHTLNSESIAIASFFDLDSRWDAGRICFDWAWCGMAQVLDALHSQSNSTLDLAVDGDFWLIHAPGGQANLAASNMPFKAVIYSNSPVGNARISGCMSRETWVEEWLPSL